MSSPVFDEPGQKTFDAARESEHQTSIPARHTFEEPGKNILNKGEGRHAQE
jgi:hypothetical protein